MFNTSRLATKHQEDCHGLSALAVTGRQGVSCIVCATVDCTSAYGLHTAASVGKIVVSW